MSNKFSFDINADTSHLADLDGPTDLEMAYQERGDLVEEFLKVLSKTLEAAESYQVICTEIIRQEDEHVGEGGESSSIALAARGMGDYAASVYEAISDKKFIGEDMADVSVDDYVKMARERIREGVNGVEVQPKIIETATEDIQEIYGKLRERWLGFLDLVGEAPVELASDRAETL